MKYKFFGTAIILASILFGAYGFFGKDDVFGALVYKGSLSAFVHKNNSNVARINVTPRKDSAPASYTVSDGLVGHWSFDGRDTSWTSATAGTVSDISGQGNTGTLTNMSQTASPTIGKIGQGLNFNGTTQYISLGTGLNSVILTGFSFSAWIKPSSIPSDSGIIANYDGDNATDANRDGFFLRLFNSGGGKIRFGVNNGATAYILRDTGAIITAGNYYHVVGTWDGTFAASGFKIYVNGVRSDTTDVVNGVVSSTQASAQEMTIGRVQFFSSTPSFPGIIDDVRVYSRALSAEEVGQLYQMGR